MDHNGLPSCNWTNRYGKSNDFYESSHWKRAFFVHGIPAPSATENPKGYIYGPRSQAEMTALKRIVCLLDVPWQPRCHVEVLHEWKGHISEMAEVK